MEYEIIISIFLNDRIICKVKLNHILVLRLAFSSTFQSVYTQTFISFLSSYMPCNLMFTLVVLLTFRPCDILHVFVIACLTLRINMLVLVATLTTFRPFYSPAFFRCLSIRFILDIMLAKFRPLNHSAFRCLFQDPGFEH